MISPSLVNPKQQAALAELLLNSSNAQKRIKSAWAGYAPKAASDIFKNVGVKLHTSAMQ